MTSTPSGNITVTLPVIRLPTLNARNISKYNETIDHLSIITIIEVHECALSKRIDVRVQIKEKDAKKGFSGEVELLLSFPSAGLL